MEFNFAKLNEELNKMNTPDLFEDKKGKKKFEEDKRFYKISKDADGNGSVKIRFLPSFDAKKERLNMFVKQNIHAIEKWYDKKKRFIKVICPSTVSQDKECPICEYCWDNYNELKDTNIVEAKKFPKTFAPKERYITNILILEDKENPENEGKVFLFEFGPQIKQIIQKSMHPSEEEIEEKGLKPFNAWDLINGRDFRLKLKDGKFTENGYPSWSESFFALQSTPVVQTEEELNELMSKTYCLDEFVSEDILQSPEEIQKALDWVLNRNPKKKKTTSSNDSTNETETVQTPKVEMPKAKPKSIEEEEQEVKPKVDIDMDSATPVDPDDFFAKFK